MKTHFRHHGSASEDEGGKSHQSDLHLTLGEAPTGAALLGTHGKAVPAGPEEAPSPEGG